MIEKKNGASGAGSMMVRAGAMGALGGLLLILAPATVAQQGNPAATLSAEQTAAAVESVASQVKSEIDRLVPTSSVEEFEASILFVVNQSEQPAPVICAAFDRLKMDTAVANNAKSAMDNVCRNIGKQRGTGAIANGSGNFGASGFASPMVSLGGGSGYTQ